ncbi:MAG: hypothetical protein OSB00_12590 [Sphingomonas bacterium]|nr:hypothetical protein [Sphingomonas bacterium]
MTCNAKAIAGGKMVIAAEPGRETGMRNGDALVTERDEASRLTIKIHALVVKQEQRSLRAIVGPHYSVDRGAAASRDPVQRVGGSVGDRACLERGRSRDAALSAAYRRGAELDIGIDTHPIR